MTPLEELAALLTKRDAAAARVRELDAQIATKSRAHWKSMGFPVPPRIEHLRSAIRGEGRC